MCSLSLSLTTAESFDAVCDDASKDVECCDDDDDDKISELSVL